MPQSFVPFAEPYTPNLVPQTTLGGEPTKQIADLERYLSEEFARIQTALTFVPVQAAYCTLVTTGTQPDQPLGTVPVQLECFNAFAPQVPNRIIPELQPDSLTTQEGGVYWLQCFVTASVEAGISYRLEIIIDGTPVDLFGEVDSSNQTDIVLISFFGLRELNPGAVIEVFGEASGATPEPYQFIVDAATLACVRVSELHGRNASAIP